MMGKIQKTLVLVALVGSSVPAFAGDYSYFHYTEQQRALAQSQVHWNSDRSSNNELHSNSQVRDINGMTYREVGGNVYQRADGGVYMRMGTYMVPVLQGYQHQQTNPYPYIPYYPYTSHY